MTPEIRAAAERLRRLANATNDDDPASLYPETANHMEDLWMVAEVFLSAFPADDDEPLSEPWLLSVGFEDRGHELVLQPALMGPTIRYLKTFREFTPGWYVGEARIWRDDTARTCGQLRRLCAALGIPLKETT